MRTATYNVDVASDRRRRENVPGHILCFYIGNFRYRKKSSWRERALFAVVFITTSYVND